MAKFRCRRKPRVTISGYRRCRKSKCHRVKSHKRRVCKGSYAA